MEDKDKKIISKNKKMTQHHLAISFQTSLPNPDYRLEKSDDLEGIVNNEPLKNKYEIIKYHQMHIFPYCLVGTIISKFEINNEKKNIYGVGILIGPRVVLTVAHNLVHYSRGVVFNAKKVYFNPISNGNFKLCDEIKAFSYYVDGDYSKALKNDNQRAQILNDWGLIFFDWDVGDYVLNKVNAYSADSYGYLKEKAGLYAFFNEGKKDNFFFKEDNSETTKSIKISIVGYTQYSEANKAYRISHPQSKDRNDNDEDDDSGSLSLDGSGSSFYQFTNSSSIRKSTVQGKIFAEVVQESREMFNSFKTMEKSLNEKNEVEPEGEKLKEEALLVSPKTAKSNSPIEYFIFNHHELDSQNLEKKNSPQWYTNVMTESKGKIINSEKEGLDVIRYRISTYKGQSGSPIFIRVKVNNGKSQDPSKPKYFYQFIGLHSRRGPMTSLSTLFTKKTNRSFSSSHHSTMTSPRKKKPKKEEKCDTSIEFLTFLLKNNFTKSIDGICDFNIALGIQRQSLYKIMTTARKTVTPTVVNDYSPPSNYMNISFILPFSSFLVTGMFLPSVKLKSLFKICSKVLHIDIFFIALKDGGGNIWSPKYDNDVPIKNIFSDEQQIHSLFFFEIEIKIHALAKTIVDNICQCNNITVDVIKLNIYDYTKLLFAEIFDSINGIDIKSNLYGELFQRIRNEVIKIIGIDEY